MGNTIRVKWRPIALVFLVFLLAAGVIALSLPRLQANFRYLPVDIAIKRYYAEQQIASDRLKVLIGFAEQAIEYHDHYRFHRGLSLLHFLRSIDPLTPGLERRPAYRHSEAAAAASLQRAPAQPAMWLQLANIRWVLNDEPETVIEPWKMSIFTGRMHSTLFTSRVQLGLAHFAELDEEGVAMLRDQLLLAWRLRPQQLMPVIRQFDRQMVVSRRLLGATNPEVLSEFEAWLERHGG